MKWYVKFCLLFRKPFIGIDLARKSGDYNSEVTMKRFMGKNYIVKIRIWK